ncbi:hypothetical protein TREES_T100002470 [Tupaia chinensis]|uniref:Uncharacterized protein n=1 Tax=Tupaia chinensis TaxID=246437 RepID=L9LD45_TUPCH|nr:hypothetical protein TREES_T100002470 [Tupaia chinensis]
MEDYLAKEAKEELRDIEVPEPRNSSKKGVSGMNCISSSLRHLEENDQMLLRMLSDVQCIFIDEGCGLCKQMASSLYISRQQQVQAWPQITAAISVSAQAVNALSEDTWDTQVLLANAHVASPLPYP